MSKYEELKQEIVSQMGTVRSFCSRLDPYFPQGRVHLSTVLELLRRSLDAIRALEERVVELERELAEARKDGERLEWLIALFRKQPNGLNLWHNPSLARSEEYADRCWGLEKLGWNHRDGEPTAVELGTGPTARSAIDATRAQEKSDG